MICLAPNYFKMLKYNQYLHLNAFKDPRQQNSAGYCRAILCTTHSTAYSPELEQSHPCQNLLFGILLSWLKSGRIPQSPVPTGAPRRAVQHQPCPKADCCRDSSLGGSPWPGDPRAGSLAPLNSPTSSLESPAAGTPSPCPDRRLSVTLCFWSGD